MSLIDSVKSRKRIISKQIYDSLNKNVEKGIYGTYIVCRVEEYEMVYSQILPDIATELKEGGFYLHATRATSAPKEFEEHKNDSNYTWVYVFFDTKPQTSGSNTISPSGKKLIFNEQ